VSVRVDPAAVGRHSRHRLRSASTAEVLVPAARRSTVGDRAVAVADPRAWNSLPVDLRLSETSSTFKTHLKSHLTVSLTVFCTEPLTRITD